MSKISELLIKLLYISVFCLPGVILRVYLNNKSKEQEIFLQNSYFLPNFVGSFIMGLGQLPALKEQYPLLHLGITVGFCGSLTTFSSWLVGVLVKQDSKYIPVDIVCGIVLPLIAVLLGKHLVIFSAKQLKRSASVGAQGNHQRRTIEEGIPNTAITHAGNPVIIQEFQAAKPCLKSGMALVTNEQSSQPSEEESGDDQEKLQQQIIYRQSLILNQQKQHQQFSDQAKHKENQLHQQLTLPQQHENQITGRTQSQNQLHQIELKNKKQFIQVIGLVLIFALLIGLLVFDQLLDQGNVYVYEALLGPLGAVTRFFLCDKLNSIIKTFQLGTFGSNLLGCIIAFVLQVTCINHGICSEIQIGMMGSLTTVSSWANDTIGNMKASYVKAAFYNLTTFVICAGIGAAIMEPSR